MPTMMQNSYSSNKCLALTQRHIRLCKRFGDCEKYIQAIEPGYTELLEKHRMVEQFAMDRDYAYDFVVYNEKELDNQVRTIFEKCKQYDRQHIGSMVLKQVFPSEIFGDLIRQNRIKKLYDLEKVVIKIENLGSEHQLFSLAQDLRDHISGVSSAIKEHEEAILQETRSRTDKEIAKNKLIRQYESNYLRIRADIGRTRAHYLFPQMKSKAELLDTQAEDDSHGYNEAA